MDYSFKNYQTIKLKKYFKKTGLFFLCHSAKLSLTEWTFSEQNLTRLELKCYKPLNKITIKTFKDSIFKNFSFNIIGLIFFINSCDIKTELNLFPIIKFLKPSFILVSIKLNNKIYSIGQIKKLDSLSYNKSVFNLYKVLNNQLKYSYILTSKKISK